MQFVFAYAGIPAGEAYDAVAARQTVLAGENTTFEGFVLQPGRSLELTTRNILRRFYSRLATDLDKQSCMATTGYAVIYVRAPGTDATRFEQAFFPSTLTVGVEWEMEGSTSDAKRASLNRLFNLLLSATVRARRAITTLHKQVVDKANRTPLLLPLGNFRSGSFEEWLKRLEQSLAQLTENEESLRMLGEAVKDFKQWHPKHQIEKSSKQCYCDERGVEFRAPGKALHGIPNMPGDHPSESCLLSAFRRLGAPFHSAFHYDVQKDSPKKLHGRFCTCHLPPAEMSGDPHLNIAPNDFVRV